MGNTIEAIRQSTDRNKRRDRQRDRDLGVHDSTDKDLSKVSEEVNHKCPHCGKDIEAMFDFVIRGHRIDDFRCRIDLLKA